MIPPGLWENGFSGSPVGAAFPRTMKDKTPKNSMQTDGREAAAADAERLAEEMMYR